MKDFFLYCFSSAYGIGLWLNTAGILMFGALGNCAANRSGNMFLGGEGIIYLSGFTACTVFVSTASLPAPVSFILSLFASIAVSVLFTLILAFLYEAKGTLILLSSFILSSAVIPLIDGAITSSKTSDLSNLLALPFISKDVRLTKLIPPSPFNVSFFAALILCVVLYILFTRTRYGRRMSIWGTAPEFAKYSGFDRKSNTYGSMILCGVLHGLSGFFSVCGTYYTCHKGFYAGMGWNALTASLIAKSNPLFVLPSTLFLSWLFNSTDYIALTHNFGFDVTSILQGIILFLTAVPVTFSFIKKTFREHKK